MVTRITLVSNNVKGGGGATVLFSSDARPRNIATRVRAGGQRDGPGSSLWPGRRSSAKLAAGFKVAGIAPQRL
jgi:hypothetical protein